MPELNRRRFLQIAGATAGFTALSNSIDRAAAIPAARVKGTVQDIEHIVVLMQENRSFDHYFGTMKGVRGFGDPRPVTLPSGKPVWNQASGGKEVLPYHPDAADLGMQFIAGLDHDWAAWPQRLQQRQVRQLDRRQGHRHDGVSDAPGHPVPLRARRQVHGVRRLPLLVHGGHRPQPLLHAVGPRRQRRHRRRARPRQPGGRLRLDHVRRASGEGRGLLEGLPGHRRRPRRRRELGLDRRRLPRQLRRQLAPLLQQLPQRQAGRPPLRQGPHRHERQGGRRLLRRPEGRRQGREAPEDLLDRRARGVLRAPQLAA